MQGKSSDLGSSVATLAQANKKLTAWHMKALAS